MKPTTVSENKRVFGIIPVGVPRMTALDRVFFFGEAAQANPPISATGLTRMLYTYRSIAERLVGCVRSDELDGSSLSAASIPAMSWIHRRFQLALFRRLLSFTSDDSRDLVLEIQRYPDDLVNDLIFADGSLTNHPRALVKALLQPRSLFGGSLFGGVLRSLLPYSRPSR